MNRVLFVEASSGGVVGGSLSGLYHLIRGLDRERFHVGMALYEPKRIEADLKGLDVAVYHVRRRRLPKEHALLRSDGYRRSKAIRPIGSSLRAGRQTARLLVEEIPAAVRLARVIRRERADVVHLGNGVRANFDGLLACVLTRTPIVCHVKGFEKYGARERWASRRTRTLVCMTQAILEHCERNGMRPQEARVVYDAVDEAWLRPVRTPAAIRGDLGVPADAPCVGLAGNIQEWKGQHVLVEAMAEVVRTHPGTHALIIGGVHRAGEAYATALRQRTAELGLERCIHFTGFRDDIVDVMNALDVVVHASIRPEPFGRVILEGMLLGKPVVATAAGGVLELIAPERTGFLVPPGDAGALAATLATLLARPAEGRRIGEQARAWARQQFSLSKQVAEMSAIYETATRT